MSRTIGRASWLARDVAILAVLPLCLLLWLAPFGWDWLARRWHKGTR